VWSLAGVTVWAERGGRLGMGGVTNGKMDAGKAQGMYVASQFSVFMVNKPGVLARALTEFARARVNIVAITMMDSAEHGVMRVVFEEPVQAREVLAKSNMPYNETEVLCVNLANKSGALAAVAEKLAKGHINISYAYCTAGARGGRTTGVLKVSDVKKAMKLLEEHNRESRDVTAGRQSKASRA
jgi:hypothetical protein